MNQWWRRRVSKREIADPASSCEAFLTGRYLELACGQGEVPPAWPWLSTLAHGDRRRLIGAAATRGKVMARAELDYGRRAQALLARKLLEEFPSERDLLELQRRALVPLELGLFGASVGPATLIRVVTAAVHDQRSQSVH